MGTVVGRDREISVLLDFVRAIDQLPASVVVEGEPGIGKTTIWGAGVAEARERGLTVLEARPTELEAKLAFAGLGDLLENVLDQVLLELPAPQRQALEIALLLESPEGAGLEQRVVGVAFLNSLRALSAKSPVVVAVDDVQWLDRATAATIEFAARRLRNEAIGFLLARRREAGSHPGLELDPVLRHERLDVGPLSLGATHALLHARLGAVHSRPVMRRLHELSGGNPFYALELGRALGRYEGRLEPGEPLPIPDELHELIAERLAALPRRTQDALAAAAALSKPTIGLLAAALGGDALERLEPAVEARVIELAGERVRFTHPLFPSAAYERASLVERRELHRALADLVSEPEERAHHLALTTEGADEGIALALEDASLRAAGRGAQDAAADLCARARGLTPAHDTEVIRRLSLREAEYALQSGDTPRARAVLEDLLGTTAEGQQRAEILTDLARVHFNGLDWRTSVSLLEQALLEAGDDHALRAQIEIHLAINLDLLRTNVPETLAHARAAATLAEQLGDDVLLGEALILQAKSELLLGGEYPTQLVRRALELEQATHALPADRWLEDYLASMRGWTDDLDGAIVALEDVEGVALKHGDEVSLNWAIARAVELECYAGRWDKASSDIERGSEIALQAGQRANEAIFLGLTALVHAHVGLEDSTREAGVRALELAERTSAAMARRTALAGLGLLELSLGEPREAHAYFEPLTAETLAAGVGEPGAMRFLPDAIEVLIELDRLAEAEELLAFLEERALATMRSSAVAAAARCRGLLAAARGELGTALTAFERALAEHEQAQMSFERGRSLLALGTVQRRARERRAARGTLTSALSIFEKLGAQLWTAKAETELGRIGGRAASAGDLTPTEQRVAALVAAGKTNGEVAAELVLSVHTVEGTLTNIYRKLGVRSRTEMARKLTG